MSNVIPPITHELGKHWEQPSTEEIQIDGTHASMTRATFTALKEYSWSNPTGVYEGKMWRRREGVEWFLCWFGFSLDPVKCSFNHRKISIRETDEEAMVAMRWHALSRDECFDIIVRLYHSSSLCHVLGVWGEQDATYEVMSKCFGKTVYNPIDDRMINTLCINRGLRLADSK